MGEDTQGKIGREEEGHGEHARDDQAVEGEGSRSWLEEVAQMSLVLLTLLYNISISWSGQGRRIRHCIFSEF